MNATLGTDPKSKNARFELRVSIPVWSDLYEPLKALGNDHQRRDALVSLATTHLMVRSLSLADVDRDRQVAVLSKPVRAVPAVGASSRSSPVEAPNRFARLIVRVTIPVFSALYAPLKDLANGRQRGDALLSLATM
jgi:hypothetical protein